MAGSSGARTLFSAASLVSGWLSDKFGIYKTLLYSIVIFAIFLLPIFTLIINSEFLITLSGCAAFIFLITIYQGSIPSTIIRIFPTKVRVMGTAFSFNLVSAIFGGFTPLFLTWLIKIAESYYVMIYYLFISSAISILTLVLGKDYVVNHDKIDDERN